MDHVRAITDGVVECCTTGQPFFLPRLLLTEAIREFGSAESDGYRAVEQVIDRALRVYYDATEGESPFEAGCDPLP